MSSGAIFVVGTSASRRARFVALLTQAGYAVLEFSHLDGAMDHVASESPPLVVLDFEPADAAALGVCHRMKAASPETFIFQISQSFASDAGSTHELESCIDAYLVDPIDPQEMLALVRSLLRLQKVEAELRDSEDRLELARESAGLAVLDWVIPTNSFVHSENFLDLFDLPAADPEAPLDPATILQRIHPEDLGQLMDEFNAESQASGRFDKEFRIRHRDGTIHWISSRGRFFSGPDGSPQRMLSLSSDVTERKTAERTNAELAAIVASSVDAIVSVDLGGLVTSWNSGAERLLGIPAAEMIGQPLADSVTGMAAEEEAFLKRMMDGSASQVETRQTRRDGTPIDLWMTSGGIRAPDGRAIGASLIMRDMSGPKQREDHIRFLMRELTHRSKNLLAVIQAMARQSLTKGVSPEEFVRRFTDRLAGLAGSHDLLSSVEWKGVSLMSLIRSQLNHYEDLFGTRIVLAGADLTVKPEAAQNIGIALHELSTNAAKYGALSNDDGIVTLAWGVAGNEPRTFALSWKESGGPPVVPPTRRGFGHVVMDRIAGRALGGNSGIRFEPDGVVWTLDVPAASAVVE